MENYYPKLKKVTEPGAVVEGSIVLSPQAQKICDRVGLQTEENGAPFRTLNLRSLADFDGEEKHSGEQYGIEVTETEVIVYADTERAASYGIKTVLDMKRDGILQTGKAVDWPAMKRRGLIEGFYGTPWSLTQELDAIRELWEQKMNTYIYSPKDDVYHREKWAALYPEENLSNLLALLNQCKKYYVDFYYMLAPGLTIRYTSEEDFEKLMAKYRQLYDLGVTQLGLLLDDIQEELTWPEDREVYETYGDAHNALCLKAYHALKELDASIQFTVCPTIYRGSPAQDYIVKMGHALPEEVSVFWTGPKTCAFDLSAEHTRDFIRHTGHKPFYWDNYPVNDAKMVVEMHLAPIANRDYELAELSDGIVANTMEHKEASMLSVISYAHFMWAPNTYDKERSFAIAIRQCLGSEFINSVELLAEFCYVSCINHMHHRKYSYLLAGEPFRKKEEILRYTGYCLEEFRYLQRRCKHPVFLKEVSPWLAKSIEFCGIVEDFFTEAASLEALQGRMRAYLDNELEVCKFEMRMLEKHLLKEN